MKSKPYIKKVLKDWRCTIIEVTENSIWVRFEDGENGLMQAEILFDTIFREGAFFDWRIVEFTNKTTGNDFTFYDLPKITRKEIEAAREKARHWLDIFNTQE